MRRSSALNPPPSEPGRSAPTTLRTGRRVRSPDAMDGGLYVAVFHLRRPAVLTVGRLGQFAFAAGLYFYVGTAQRNLPARLARHARRGKLLRWHVDYLSTRARMLGAILIPGPRRRECEIAAKLACLMPRPVPRFGASDCRCEGHLFHAAQWP